MTKYNICSRNDRPPDNSKTDRSISCGKCNALIHLKCIEINVTISELFSHENMRLFCNACHEPSKTTTKLTTIKLEPPKLSTPTTQRQRQITDFTSNSNSNILEAICIIEYTFN